MKRKINLDRKSLYVILCLVVVSVFTLSIAYAALSVTLNIVGSAQVNASNWDIHLNNVVVTNGSVNSTAPNINGVNSLNFSATLTKPGDFYEFTVDIVNGGTIDAMINNVIKTPTLTAEQAKYFKYEVSYQNGDAISIKQNITAGSTTPIKVRIEYRTDLVSSDLPNSNTTLNLGLTLEYVQSDGTGNNINNNGALAANYQILSEGTSSPMRFRSSAEISDFLDVEVNGSIIDKSNYTTYSGSTVIELNPEYVLTLPAGENSLKILSSDGYAETSFNIAPNLKEFSLTDEVWSGSNNTYTFVYEEGMTWKEWLNSQYNTGMGSIIAVIVKGGPDIMMNKLQDILGGNSSPVDYNSKIQSDGVYKLGVTFTINGTFYQTYMNMTFGEWVNSKFNTYGCTANDEHIMCDGGGMDLNSVIPTASDKIVVDGNYTVSSNFPM